MLEMLEVMQIVGLLVRRFDYARLLNGAKRFQAEYAQRGVDLIAYREGIEVLEPLVQLTELVKRLLLRVK